jgi:riboflavin synthase
MFTGIVQALGSVAAREARGDGARLTLAVPAGFLAGVAPGDSIAVNGCCLTAVELGADRFGADCSKETLALTTLGALAPGAPVNLEKALALGAPLGGHLVAGHVDGVGEVVRFAADGAGAAAGWKLVVRVPAVLARYLARKGSVAVDGVSLTVNAADADSFTCAIVPHTLAHTAFGGYRPGTRVNLEVDLVARYVERLLEAKA